MAAGALASRIVFLRAGQILVTRYPDAVLAVVLCAQLVTALGIAVFASASVVLATALDEGWE